MISRIVNAVNRVIGVNPTTPPPPKKPSGHAGGGLSDKRDELEMYIPKMQMEIYDTDTEKAMTPELVQSARSAGTLKPIFYNPNQTIDYRVIAAVLKNTICGPLVNQFTQLLVGLGFFPEIELLEPSGDSKKDQAEIEKYDHVIQDIKKVEREIDRNNDITFVEYVTMLIDSANSYGRSALIWDSATSHRGIPTTVKYAHPEDLSITVFDENTWRLQSVLWRYGSSTPVPADSMVYLWNPLITAKYHNAWQYGGSMVLPFLDASRTLRKIISTDFPAMAKATWASLFIMAVRPQGQTSSQKRSEYGDIVKRMIRGGPNLMMENPEDISFNNVDFNPKIKEFTELTHFLIKYCVASFGLPQSMFFDEGESNRSTARSKIQLVMASTVNPIRERLGRQISGQSYQKWFEHMHPDLKDKIRIRMTFKDLQISEWYDKISAALELDSRHELGDQAFGDLVELPDYLNIIKPEAPTVAGGSGSKPGKPQSDDDGKNLDLGKAINKEGME